MAENDICCPPFIPEPWDDKIIEWTDKKFIKDKVFTFLHIPINFGKVMRRADAVIRNAGGEILDNLALSDHTSKWNMDVYIAVNKEIAGAKNVALSGKYYSKVYEGAFNETGKWCRDFETILKEKGYSVKKWFMWYTTCPKCAKKYGRNYVVILSEIA